MIRLLELCRAHPSYFSGIRNYFNPSSLLAAKYLRLAAVSVSNESQNRCIRQYPMSETLSTQIVRQSRIICTHAYTRFGHFPAPYRYRTRVGLPGSIVSHCRWSSHMYLCTVCSDPAASGNTLAHGFGYSCAYSLLSAVLLLILLCLRDCFQDCFQDCYCRDHRDVNGEV